MQLLHGPVGYLHEGTSSSFDSMPGRTCIYHFRFKIPNIRPGGLRAVIEYDSDKHDSIVPS